MAKFTQTMMTKISRMTRYSSRLTRRAGRMSHSFSCRAPIQVSKSAENQNWGSMSRTKRPKTSASAATALTVTRPTTRVPAPMREISREK